MTGVETQTEYQLIFPALIIRPDLITYTVFEFDLPIMIFATPHERNSRRSAKRRSKVPVHASHNSNALLISLRHQPPQKLSLTMYLTTLILPPRPRILVGRRNNRLIITLASTVLKL